MTVLTVGSGEEFATIASAIAASQDGDVIQVKAGTYTNDFAIINTSITLEAVGGQVHLVATKAPPDDKGYFTIGTTSSSPDVTISGFSFSGVKIPKALGNNGAGIRYQSGDLTIEDSSFSNNQNGILATPLVADTGTISVTSSVFNDNGAGDGYSHNLYIGDVASFSITDSLIEDANAGHEIKSRAYNSVIEDNRIVDTAAGTASYSIDLPNGGNALVEGNSIEQGPHSDNPKIIAYGEEGNILPNSSLTVTGNTIFNDQIGPMALGLWNDTSITATVSDNQFWGLPEAQVASGPVDESDNTFLAQESTISTVAPWNLKAPGTISSELSDGSSLGQSDPISYGYANTSISGGTSRLTVTVSGANDTVAGGTGGLTITEKSYGVISTDAGATDNITIVNSATVSSAGFDTITAGTGTDVIDISGAASIKGSSGELIVTGEASAKVTISAGKGAVAYSGNGGSLKFTGGAGWESLKLGDGPSTVTAGSGNMSLVGGAGAENITFGSGSDDVTLGGGAATLDFVSGKKGHVMITGYNPTLDNIVYTGFGSNPITSQHEQGTWLIVNLKDGTEVTFVGVTKLT